MVLDLSADGPVTSVAIAPDGRRFATGHRGGAVVVREFPLGERGWSSQVTGSTPGTTGKVTASVDSVAFSPDGADLRAADASGRLYAWTADGGGPPKAPATRPVTAGKPIDPARQIAFSPTGQTVLSAQSDGLWVHDPSGVKPDRHLDNVPASKPGFSPDGRVGFAVSGATVKFFSLPDDGRLLGTAGEHRAVPPSPATGRPRRWGKPTAPSAWSRPTDGRWAAPCRGIPGPVTCLLFSADDRMVFSGGADGTLRLWDLQSGRELCRLLDAQRPLECLALSPDGQALVAGLDDGRVWLFDFGRIARLRELEPLARQAHESLRTAASGSTAATTGPALKTLQEWYALRFHGPPPKELTGTRP